MNRKVSLGAAIAFMLIVAAATFSATMTFAQLYFNRKSTDLERSREMYVKFTDVDRTVRQNYSGEINEKELNDSVAQGYIKGLGDKYAAYISAEEFKRSTLSKEGEDVGIGAVLETSPDGYLSVLEVYPDSPAQVAGIQVDDHIVQINDINLTPENVGQAATLVQGEAGTKLTLVVRKGTEDVTIPDLTRRVISIPSVYSRVIAETSVGYVLIKQFNENTSDQFNRELHKMIEAGVTSLIFDVRDNKGASMTSAVRVLDKLLPSGTIYSATYKDGTTEELAVSDANEISLPMVVITNTATSSAAELFAQDLKDFTKASIVGQTTVGKGVLLNRIQLSDGSAIDLTVATLIPKSGITFDSVGVKPDYEIVPLNTDWTKADETTDPTLRKALELALAMHKVEVTVQAEASAASSSSTVASSSSAPAPSSSQAPASSESSASGEPSSESEEQSGDSSVSESSKTDDESSTSSGDYDEDSSDSSSTSSESSSS